MTRTSDTAFITTIFPASRKFLPEFLKSLLNQTEKDFDLLVFNDGITDFELLKEEFFELNILEYKVNYTPAVNREYAIKKAMELGYLHLIFGDSDDYFSGNRVDDALKALTNYDIVVNDITIIADQIIQENYFTSIIAANPFNLKRLINSNVAGLSNTAVNTCIVPENINFNKELIAVDWFFFSIVLANANVEAYFTNDSVTYYRQHNLNTVGMMKIVNGEKVKLGIRTKLYHYKEMAKYCRNNSLTEYAQWYEGKLNEIQDLENRMADNLFFKKYLAVINKNFKAIFNGWWSEIISVKEFEKYESTIN